MTCEKCGIIVEEGTLICPECGEEIALKEQDKKLKEISEQKKEVVNKHFTGVLFKLQTIFISILSGLYFIGILYSLVYNNIEYEESALLIDIISIGTYSAIAICALFTAIISWRLHYKKVEYKYKTIEKINMFNMCMYVLSIILIVLLSILTILFLLAGGWLEVLLYMSLLIGLMVLVMFVYKRTKDYNIIIAETSETNKYRTLKEPPHIILWVFSILNVLAAIALAVSNPYQNLFSIICSFPMGGYLICTALMFTSFHEKFTSLEKQFENELKVQEHLYKQTSVAKSKFIKPENKVNE